MIEDRIKLPGKTGAEFRLAKRKDYEDFYGYKIPFTAKAFSFFFNGELVGIAGYKKEKGAYIIFSDMKEGVIIPKTTIMRAAFIVASLTKDTLAPMYAISKNKKLCEILGGKQVDDNVFKWE